MGGLRKNSFIEGRKEMKIFPCANCGAIITEEDFYRGLDTRVKSCSNYCYNRIKRERGGTWDEGPEESSSSSRSEGFWLSS